MKILGLIIVLGVLYLILRLMWHLGKAGFTRWNNHKLDGQPWKLEEQENEHGTHYRYVAVKPGHKPRALSPWLDFSTYSDDAWEHKSQAEITVADMNYKGLPQ